MDAASVRPIHKSCHSDVSNLISETEITSGFDWANSRLRLLKECLVSRVDVRVVKEDGLRSSGASRMGSNPIQPNKICIAVFFLYFIFLKFV